MQPLTLTIGGMSCSHCVRAVDEALKTVDGVTVDEVTVGRATVHVDPAKADAARLRQVVEAEGFAVLSTTSSTGRVIA